MSIIPGAIPVTGFLGPTDSDDVYAVTDALYGIDGLRNVTDTTTRNLITAERRREGMLVGTSDKKYWRLKASPWAFDDTDWDLALDLGVGVITAGLWDLIGSDIVTGASLYSPAVPNILPAVDDVQNLGSKQYRWKDLFLGSVIDFSSVLDFTVGGGSPDDTIGRFDNAGLSLYSSKAFKSTNGAGELHLDWNGNANWILLSTDGLGLAESSLKMDPTFAGLYGDAIVLGANGSGAAGVLALYGLSDITIQGNGVSGMGFGDFSADIAVVDVTIGGKMNHNGYDCAPVMISAKGGVIEGGVTKSALIGGHDNKLGAGISSSLILGGVNNTVSDNESVIIGGNTNIINASSVVMIGGSYYTATDNSTIYLCDDTILVSQKSLKSDNGSGQINLDLGGVASNVLISTDGGGGAESFLRLEPTWVELAAFDLGGQVQVGTNSHKILISEADPQPKLRLDSTESIQIKSELTLSYSKINVGSFGGDVSTLLLEAFDNVSGMFAKIDFKAYDATPVIDFSVTSTTDVALRINGNTNLVELKNGLGSFTDNSLVINTDARQLIDTALNPIIDWKNTSSEGAVYDQDYSTTYVNRSLVDKEFVTTAVAGGAGSKYVATVSFTANVTQTITHGLSDSDILVELIDYSGGSPATGEKIWGAQVTNYTTNTVDITLSTTISAVRVIIKK